MKIKRLFTLIFFSIFIIVITMGFAALLSFFQSKLFVPSDYILWVFKYPISRLFFVFEIYIIFVVLNFIFYKKFPIKLGVFSFVKQHRKWTYPIFIFINLLLIYILIFNVCVITDNQIINYSFLFPHGEIYNYNDIVQINTGVYGKKLYLPFTHSKGEFYYFVTLDDGTEINLNDSVGGTRKNIDRFIAFEMIDKTLVNMGINKKSNMEHFELVKSNLDKVYYDRIENILNNINNK